MGNIEIEKILNGKFDIFKEVNDRIWDFAEPKFQEIKSSSLQKDILLKEGFVIVENLGEINTAFSARYGSGKPIIGILGEFDALPNLSQEADSLEHRPIQNKKWGHGCGHNTLGAGCMEACVAIKDYMKEKNLNGTIVYYGCPGEEGGAGKAFMAREGCFDECDICLAWHPYSVNFGSMSSLANVRVIYNFHGVSSHAAASPHLGRSALDAVELMNVGANYLREHTLPETRIHYAITNTGGDAPNVVQAEAEVIYAIRAPHNEEVLELLNRVNSVAKGAAMMTETTVDIRVVSAYADVLQNKTLDSLIYEKMKEVLPIKYTQEELEYAKKFKAVGDIRDIKTYENMAVKMLGKDGSKLFEGPMVKGVFPPTSLKMGSTDVGDVSWNVPTSWFGVACYSLGTAAHSWQTVAQGKSVLAHKGMYAAAQVLSLASIELFENPRIIEEAKKDFMTAKRGVEYKSIIPIEVKAGSF